MDTLQEMKELLEFIFSVWPHHECINTSKPVGRFIQRGS
jgi:hypothetical protein